jgi:hypothetical protein
MNLNTNIHTDKSIPICLISKEPILNNICLPCNHSYEYEYLYEEIKQQKNRHKKYFKCPYCRCIYHSCIPYYELDNVEKLKNINLGTILHVLDCNYNNCKFPANKFKNGNFCWKHYTKSIIVVDLCKGICLNGKPCKNKSKDDMYCNIHKKIKQPKKMKEYKEIDSNEENKTLI